MIEDAATPPDEPTTDSATFDALLRRIERLEEVLAMTGVHASTGSVQPAKPETAISNTSSDTDPGDDVSDLARSTTARRRFLKLAGTAAAGSLVFRPTAAAAADGANLVIGSTTNQASSTTRLQRGYTAGSGLPESVVTFESVASGGSGDGAVGRGVGFGGVGLLGISAGFGVRGESTTGYALYAGGNGRLGFDAHVAVGPPPSGEITPGVFPVYQSGDVVLDGAGEPLGVYCGKRRRAEHPAGLATTERSGDCRAAPSPAKPEAFVRFPDAVPQSRRSRGRRR